MKNEERRTENQRSDPGFMYLRLRFAEGDWWETLGTLLEVANVGRMVHAMCGRRHALHLNMVQSDVWGHPSMVHAICGRSMRLTSQRGPIRCVRPPVTLGRHESDSRPSHGS
jgi:hypothetical protein